MKASERVHFNADGAKLHVHVNSDGWGKVELDGEDISRKVSTISIELIPGETARAVLSFWISDVEVTTDDTAVVCVPSEHEKDMRVIADAIAQGLHERQEQRLAKIRAEYE